MKLKYLIILIITVFAGGCNAQERREEAIKYLEERKYELGRDANIIRIIDASNLNVTNTDLARICDIGTVEAIFFHSSRLGKGAILGLAKCNKLQAITYEPLSMYYKENTRAKFNEETTLPLEDIPDHDQIPHLFNEKETVSGGLIFNGNTYGDDLLAALGKLRKVRIIWVRGLELDPRVQYDNGIGYGSLTDEGIRRFVEARTDGVELSLNFTFQPKITDKAFEYLLNLKGLKYIAFGPKTELKINVTEKGAQKFREEYRRKYGYYPTVFVDY
jgi:hypothetical protein